MNHSMLLKATSSDDSPTPGYLFGEIAKLTTEGIDIVEKIVKVLVDRLKRKEANVRRKTLVVIKHVCRRGDPGFRRKIQANVAAVKECLQFTGPADPLKGDQPYRAVREAAKEALEAIFDDSSDITPVNSALAQRIQGFGVEPPAPASEQAGSSSYYDEGNRSGSLASSGGYSGGGYGHGGGRALPSESHGYTQSAHSFGGSNQKYGGIGNPNFQDPRNMPKGFLDRVKDRVEEYSDRASKTVTTTGIQNWLGTSKHETSSSYRDVGASRSVSSYQGAVPASSSLPSASSHQWNSSLGGTGDPRSPRFASSGTTSSSSVNRTGVALSDGKHERALIDDLCSRGGVRAVPARDKLESFVSACKTLNSHTVMPILFEKLTSSDWKVQHKALCVCEALVQGGEDLEAYVDYIDERGDILEMLLSSSQPTLRNRCKKVWVLIYGEEPASAAPSGSEQTPNEKSKTDSSEPDLLGFDAEDSVDEPRLDAAARTNEVTKEPSLVNPAPASSLFSGVQVKASVTKSEETTSSAHNTDETDLLGGLATETTTSAPSDALSDGFSKLSFINTSAGTPASNGTHSALVQSSENGGAETSKPAGTAFSFISQSDNDSVAAGTLPPTGAPLTASTPGQTVPMSTSVPTFSKPADTIGNAFDTLAPQQQRNTPAFQNGQAPSAGGLPMQMQGGPMANFSMNSQQQPQQQPMMNGQHIQQQYGLAHGQPHMMGGSLPNQQLPGSMLQQQQQQTIGHTTPLQQQFPMMGMQLNGMRNSQALGAPQQVHLPKPVPKATQQPDKFDFVSSTMAEMK